ncbi:putative ABC transporter permease [Clostridium isatidis]|uniref:ABC transporter permease n=1 Tax=Clostridium isatidis TaxID=182773 RepID=A0A343JDN1_9CLOT|nr:putative ABC transporter permease [Clostridium isatidis]ASW43639.1 hypothetical protein BEN51_09145 [Clostridium isatidis]
MNFQLYELLLLFFIYSFLGWCLEVSYAAINTGKFVNRGFLYGVICPIYGIGAVIVIISLTPLINNILILFLGSVFLTSFLEFITGFILEKVFQNKWWDYSNLPFNIKGYICLRFSIYWGIGCVFIMKIIQPFIYTFIKALPIILGKFIITLMILLILIDIIATIITVLNLNKRLKLIDEISRNIKKLSDEIGQTISDTSLKVSEKISPIKEDLNNRKLILDELKVKYKEMFEKNIRSHNRILKAFPSLRSKKYNLILEKLKNYHIKK